MNKYEFDSWLYSSKYSLANDWNYQEIGEYHYYFIKHETEERYALIKETPTIPYNVYKTGHKYQVLVQGWTDYNGWNDV